MKARIYGLNALEETFENLKDADKKKLMIRSFKKALQPMSEMMHSTVPVGETHNLQDSIGIKELRRGIAVKAGAMVSGGKKGYIGTIANYGTRERFRRNGASTGSMKGTFWREKSNDATIEKCKQILRGEWYYQIERLMRRNDRRIYKELIG